MSHIEEIREMTKELVRVLGPDPVFNDSDMTRAYRRMCFGPANTLVSSAIVFSKSVPTDTVWYHDSAAMAVSEIKRLVNIGK